MTEKDLKDRLAAILRQANRDPPVLRSLEITDSTSSAVTIFDFVRADPFDLFQDTSDWNPDPKSNFLVDVAGGITPDLVVRSRASRQNRIYIEVKLHGEIRGHPALSQVTRQFLHLLATSQLAPLAGHDISRAVLLAAPAAWFAEERNLQKWRYFLEHYADLARLPEIDITLGTIKLDFLL